MKELFKNTSNVWKASSFLLLLLSVNVAFAKGPVAVVVKMKGNVFIKENNQIRPAQVGSEVGDFSEVFTEEGAQVSLKDFYDHKFHLSGSGQMKFLNKIIELQSGYLWTQSMRDGAEGFSVQTANGSLDYTSGEFVTSFDAQRGKTQVMVINGYMKFSNIQNLLATIDLKDGQFSYIHKSYENGYPRIPTPVGYKTFKKVTSLFSDISVIDESTPVFRAKPKKRAGRFLASVEMPKKVVSRGKATFIPDNRMEKATAEKSLLSNYQRKIKRYKRELEREKPFRPNYNDSNSTVSMRIFGIKKPPHQVKAFPRLKKASLPAGRAPASIQIQPKRKRRQSATQDDFDAGMVEQYRNQSRHSNEVRSLIKELKTYDQDYKVSY